MLVAVGLAHTIARAQADFQPGYVVQTSGDTLRGELDYRTARQSGQRSRFRATPGGPVVTYQPTELRSFGFPQLRLVYRSLVIEELPTTLPYRVAAPATAPMREAAFLEVQRDGPAQLYYLVDARESGNHYYVRTPNLPLTELRHEYKEVEQSGHTFKEEQNGFRQLLAQGLIGCPAAQALLPHLPYSERAFKQVVDAYNACVAPPSEVVQAVDKYPTRAGIGVLGGVQRSQVTFTDPYTSDQHSTTVTAPVYGLDTWLHAPFLSRQLALHAQLVYQPQSYSFTYVPTFYGGQSGQPVTATVHEDFLRLPVLLRYYAPTGRVRPLVEAGVSLGYKLQNTGTYQRVSASGTTQTVSLDAELQQQRTDFAYFGGLGVSIATWGGRALTLMGRLEQPLNNHTIATTTLRLYGLLALDLIK